MTAEPTRALLNIGLITGLLSIEYYSHADAVNNLTAINIARKARANEVEISHPTGICIIDPRRVISLTTVDYELAHAIHIAKMPIQHTWDKEGAAVAEQLDQKEIGIR